MTLYMTAAGLFAVFVVCAANRRFTETKWNAHSFLLLSVFLFLSAFTLRVLLGFYAEGFEVDMNTFKAWARITNEVGFQRIYRQDIFLDYPPGYLYILTVLEKIRLAFGIEAESGLFTLIIKLPSILGDLCCAGVLLYLAKKKLHEGTAVFLSAAYLFCPAVFINSAVWGQADSFCVSILLASVLLLYKEKYIPSAVIYGVSIACKPQMLVFVPLYLFFMIRKKEFMKLLVGITAAAVVILLIATPYTKNFNYIWLFEQYRETMDGYLFYSVNAYNFWALIGKNWAALPNHAGLNFVLDFAGPVLATALCGFAMLRAKRDEVLFAAPFILMATVYIFTVKMHERYLFHVLIFMLLAYIYIPDKRLLYAFSAVSLMHCFNVCYVLYLYNVKGGSYDPNELIVKVASLLQVLAYLYLLYVSFRVYIKGECKQPRERVKAAPRFLAEKTQEHRLGRKDLIAMAAVTAVYAVVAFWGLGGHETALTTWTPDTGDTVVLRAENPVDTLTFLVGIAPDSSHYRSRVGREVQIETSPDGIAYTDRGKLNEVGVMAWSDMHMEESFQYIRLTALDEQVAINEVALKMSGANAYETTTLVSGEGAALLDEQAVVPLYGTYYESSYFDEVYHARTAYEHIIGLEPYENTHPPLGKLIISLGIRIFGMNPFGWRFMGTLFGVLMLPCLYHLLKQLFGSIFFCTAGTVLFAFDFMHYTQTRIATIDTYAVFFLILMYSFMVMFLRLDMKTTPMNKLLVPLALSGIFMGLGAASKWTVIYGGAGLAVLLFGKLFAAYRQEKYTGGDVNLVLTKCFHICLWCLLLFIAIPFALYFAAFLPMTRLSHNSLWASFFNYQVTMFSYHSTLVAEHFFSSPWYEWPFVIKPIWFYANNNLREAGAISTITSMGNPILWWSFIPAFVFSVMALIRKKELAPFVAVTGFLSVYLPWVLVTRITFIYHYFTAVPFLIICLLYGLREAGRLFERREISPVKSGRWAAVLTPVNLFTVIFVAGNLVLFAVFLPVLSGFTTTTAYAKALEWLPQWYFAY